MYTNRSKLYQLHLLVRLFYIHFLGPAVINLTFGYLGKLLAVCRSYIQPKVLPMLLKTVSDHLYSASLAISFGSNHIEGTLLEKLLTIVEYCCECTVAYEKRYRRGVVKVSTSQNVQNEDVDSDDSDAGKMDHQKKMKNSDPLEASTSINLTLLLLKYNTTISDLVPILLGKFFLFFSFFLFFLFFFFFFSV